MSFNTNLINRIPSRQSINLVEVFTFNDLLANSASYVGGILTLLEDRTYRFKVSDFFFPPGDSLVLQDNSFIESDLNDERTNLVFVSATTAVSTDGNTIRARNLVFVQAGPGELMNLTYAADQTSRFINCIFAGFGGTTPVVRAVSGQLLEFNFTAFFEGARLVQDSSGGIFGIEFKEKSTLFDGGVPVPSGLIEFEVGSITNSLKFSDSVIILLGNGSVGINKPATSTIVASLMNESFFSPFHPNSVIMSVENPDAFIASAVLTSEVDPNAFGSFLRCEPISSLSLAAPGTGTMGVSQTGDGDLIASDSAAGLIYRFDGLTVDSPVSIAAPAPGGSIRSLAWFKGDMYSVNAGTATIYQHSGFSTTILNSIAAPSGNPSGIVFVGENLVSIDNVNKTLWVHDGFSTTILEAIDISTLTPGISTPFGLAFDGINIHIGDVGNNGRVYVMKGVSNIVQYIFDSEAVSLRDLWVTFDQTSKKVGYLASDLNTNEYHLYDHPVTLDHSARTWELTKIPGIRESSDRGGVEFSDLTSRLVTIANQNEWTEISGANISYACFSEFEKMAIHDETIGEIIWTGTRDRARIIAINVNMDSASANQIFELAVSIDGIIQKDSIARASFPTASQSSAYSTAQISRDLVDGKLIKPMTRNITSAGNADFNQCKVSIT